MSTRREKLFEFVPPVENAEALHTCFKDLGIHGQADWYRKEQAREAAGTKRSYDEMMMEENSGQRAVQSDMAQLSATAFGTSTITRV